MGQTRLNCNVSHNGSKPPLAHKSKSTMTFSNLTRLDDGHMNRHTSFEQMFSSRQMNCVHFQHKCPPFDAPYQILALAHLHL